MRILVRALAGAILLSLASCAPFTSRVDPLMEGEESAAFQAYNIPKTIIHAIITEDSDKNRKIKMDTEQVIDPKYQFKVDLNRSGFHKDTLTVETHAGSAYLKRVYVNSEDRSGEIVKKSLDIFKKAIGGPLVPDSLRSLPSDGNFAKASEKHLLTVQFDPFVAGELANTNKMLKRKGFCVAVFDRRDRPLSGSCFVHKSSKNRAQEVRVQNSQPAAFSGFYYRKRNHHRVVVYKKKARKRWRVIWSGLEAFENQSDLMQVKVDRGAFITMEATLLFGETDDDSDDHGILTSYTMNKPSELNGFMGIPISIVTAIVAIPGLQVQSETNKLQLQEKRLGIREERLKLRQQELDQQRSASFRNGPRQGSSANRGFAFNKLNQHSQTRMAQFFEGCRDQREMTEERCKALWEHNERGL